MGIDETKDLVNFVKALVDKLEEHKRDDGIIDTAEIAGTLVTSAPAALSALVGAGDVAAELADLTPEEKEELNSMVIPILTKLASMFVKIEA